jgi:deoxyribonuclease V
MRPYSEKVRAAIAEQKLMAPAFVQVGFPENVRFIGGADAAFARSADGMRTGSVGSQAIGIVIVWDMLNHRLVDAAYARVTVDFPYVPGLLSFREEPIISAAIEQLSHSTDVWMFDGQGRAHPRGVGLATHMGIRMGTPAIGAAKSVLLGRYEMPEAFARELARSKKKTRGALAVQADANPLATAPVMHNGVEIARAVWMKRRIEPVIVSQGHQCTLDQAVATVIASTLPGEWLPEPTRLADELTKRTRDLTEQAGRALVRAAVG